MTDNSEFEDIPMASIDDLVALRDAKRKRTSVMIQGKRYILQELTEADRSELELKYRSQPHTLRAHLIVASWIDARGNRIASDDDVPLIMQLPYRVTDKLSEEIDALNGWNNEIDDTKKN